MNINLLHMVGPAVEGSIPPSPKPFDLIRRTPTYANTADATISPDYSVYIRQSILIIAGSAQFRVSKNEGDEVRPETSLPCDDHLKVLNSSESSMYCFNVQIAIGYRPLPTAASRCCQTTSSAVKTLSPRPSSCGAACR